MALALGKTLPVIISLPLSILAGMAAGMVWGGAIGLIKAKLQINEVIVAIMLNYIAQLLTSYFVNNHLMAKGSMTPQTEILPAGMQLPVIVQNSQLTTSLYIALFMCLVYWFVFRHTVFGYEVKALGNNPTAAGTGGVHTVWTTVLVMALSGALASMAGIFEVFGTYGRFIDGFSPGLGFTGIAIAFIGQGTPIGIILAAVLFGGLQAGAMQMGLVEGVSAQIDKVIQGLVIIFIATPNFIRYLVLSKKGR
jgi:simple sugar transport system permease protein